MLTQAHLDYLRERGYTDQYLAMDQPFAIQGDYMEVEGRRIKDCDGHLAWMCRSMGNTRIGIQTRDLTQKYYRWHQFDDTEHLAPVFAAQEDWKILWSHGSVILTEGIFDRLAIKRALPKTAVIARLSKGVPPQLKRLLMRYAKTVWTAFDLDDPGEEATARTQKVLAGLDIWQLTFPFKDLSEMLAKRGLPAVKACLERQIGALS